MPATLCAKAMLASDGLAHPALHLAE